MKIEGNNRGGRRDGACDHARSRKVELCKKRKKNRHVTTDLITGVKCEYNSVGT